MAVPSYRVLTEAPGVSLRLAIGLHPCRRFMPSGGGGLDRVGPRELCRAALARLDAGPWSRIAADPGETGMARNRDRGRRMRAAGTGDCRRGPIPSGTSPEPASGITLPTEGGRKMAMPDEDAWISELASSLDSLVHDIERGGAARGRRPAAARTPRIAATGETAGEPDRGGSPPAPAWPPAVQAEIDAFRFLVAHGSPRPR